MNSRDPNSRDPTDYLEQTKGNEKPKRHWENQKQIQKTKKTLGKPKTLPENQEKLWENQNNFRKTKKH